MWAAVGERLWDGLIAVFGATVDQLLEFPACVLLAGLVMRRERGEPIDWPDLIFLLLFVLTAGWLARRIVTQPERPLDGWRRVPKGTSSATASLGHLPWTAFYFWMASVLWTYHDALERQDHLGVGVGFLVVPAGFLLLRVAFWIKRRCE